MRKIAAASLAAMVLTQTFLPGGLAQTATTSDEMSVPVAVDESASGYDKYLPTDMMIPSLEPELTAPAVTASAQATPTVTTTPVMPKEFLKTDKFSYVFVESGNTEVNELQLGDQFAVRLKFDVSKLNNGDIIDLGTEGLTFKDADLPQMTLANNLGYAIATFDNLSKEAGKPALRVQKIETHEDSKPDFGWEAQIMMPVEVEPDYALKAMEKNEPIIPFIGIVEQDKLQLVEPSEAQENPLPPMVTREVPSETTSAPSEDVALVDGQSANGDVDVEAPQEAVQAAAAESIVEPAAEEKVAVAAENTSVAQADTVAEKPLDQAQDVINAVEKTAGDLAGNSDRAEKSQRTEPAAVPFAAPAESRAATPVASGVATAESSAPAVAAPAPAAAPTSPAARPASTSRPMLAMTGASVLGVLLVATVLFIIGSSFLARPKGRHS